MCGTDCLLYYMWHITTSLAGTKLYQLVHFIFWVLYSLWFAASWICHCQLHGVITICLQIVLMDINNISWWQRQICVTDLSTVIQDSCTYDLYIALRPLYCKYDGLTISSPHYTVIKHVNLGIQQNETFDGRNSGIFMRYCSMTPIIDGWQGSGTMPRCAAKSFHLYVG